MTLEEFGYIKYLLIPQILSLYRPHQCTRLTYGQWWSTSRVRSISTFPMVGNLGSFHGDDVWFLRAFICVLLRKCQPQPIVCLFSNFWFSLLRPDSPQGWSATWAQAAAYGQLVRVHTIWGSWWLYNIAINFGNSADAMEGLPFWLWFDFNLYFGACIHLATLFPCLKSWYCKQKNVLDTFFVFSCVGDFTVGIWFSRKCDDAISDDKSQKICRVKKRAVGRAKRLKGHEKTWKTWIPFFAKTQRENHEKNTKITKITKITKT